MEITFQNKKPDFEVYYDYFLRQTEEGKQLGKNLFIARLRFGIPSAALLLALPWGIFGYLGASFAFTWLVLAFFIGILLASEGLYLLVAKFKPYYDAGWQFLKKNENSLSSKDLEIFQLSKTIKITDEWLEASTSEALHRWRWGLVDSIGLTPDFIFLHVGKCFVFYIPRRDFVSNDDFVDFGKKLVELQLKNKDQPIATRPKLD